jgi:ribosomal protein S11
MPEPAQSIQFTLINQLAVNQTIEDKTPQKANGTRERYYSAVGICFASWDSVKL